MRPQVFQARPKYAAPSHNDGEQSLPTDANHKVHLRHPGYSDGGNILLALPALDDPHGGIHHETARIACAILANNSWEGFLTERKGGPPVQAGPDGILRGRNYYFVVSQDTPEDKYAIVPSFAHWRFPHDDLPPSWTSCEPPKLPHDRPLPRLGTLAEATLARDISCRITNHIEGTEHAHLVPRSEESWFSDNGMFRYTNQQRPGSAPVDDAQNAMLLRSDLHTIFDQKRFAVVPKGAVLVVHITAPGSSLELTRLYHNVSLQPLVGVTVQYLLARFAWTIFAHSVNFVQQGLKRTLCVYAGDGETSIKDLSGDQCRQLFMPAPKSRSQSPRKRAAAAAPEEEEQDDHEESVRGRRRQRSPSMPSQIPSFNDKLWTTSQETLTDWEMWTATKSEDDGNDNTLEF